MDFDFVRRLVRHGLFAAMLVAWMLPGPSLAQDVNSVLADAEAKSEQVNRVLRALQSADQVTQYALIEALLKEKDKALRRIGREYALFSTNPVLQNMAVESVFETNIQVRLDMTAPVPAEALGWIEAVGGAQNGQSGAVVLPVGKYDANSACWIYDFRACRFSIVGNTVQFRFYANGGESENRAQAVLTLQPDGVLRGTIVSGFGRGQVAIDLKE